MAPRATLKALAGLFAGALLFLAGQPAVAKDLCSAQEKGAANHALSLTSQEVAVAVAEHLPWGAPRPLIAQPNEQLLVQRDYMIEYDVGLRVPIWAADHVTGDKIDKVRRSDCFRADPRLSKAAASTPGDYDEPIFDQGHLTPSADLTTSRLAVHNSFVMSNMTPQVCQFNRGVWQILEGLTRLWAKEYGEVYVLSGSIFDRNGDGVRDPDASAVLMTSKNGNKRVAVPSAFYKIIAHRQPDGSLVTLTVMIPHDQADVDGEDAYAYIGSHIVSLAKVGAVSGLAFFQQGSPAINEATNLWPFTRPGPTSLTNSPQCRGTAGAVIQADTYVLPH
jgi:DNA/RNA endonuclease G (NUC1)